MTSYLWWDAEELIYLRDPLNFYKNSHANKLRVIYIRHRFSARKERDSNNAIETTHIGG
jgi:hypothetical protein